MNRVSVTPISEMKSQSQIDDLKKELSVYQACIKHDPKRFFDMTSFSVICGSHLSDCCKPVDKEILHQVGVDAVHMLLSGEMELTGKVNNWSCGFMGSRWFDMDAKKYGVSYIRAAFYSKDRVASEHGKRFAIQIIVEKAR